jgi:cell division septum initiation protein DivIVA
MSDETMQAEMQYWQARTDEMQVSIERLRESRDEARADTERARTSCDLLMAEITRLEQVISEQGSRIDRLTLHLQQGIEL